VVRLAPDGTLRWQVEFPKLSRAYATGIAPLPDGGAVVVARRINRRERPLWMRLNSKGTLTAQVDLGEPGCLPAAISATKDGTIVVGHCTVDGKQRAWMEGLDAHGARRWRYTPRDTVGALAAIGVHGETALAVGWEHGGKGRKGDALLVRITLDGRELGRKTYGAAGADAFDAVAATARGWVVGGSTMVADRRTPWVVGLSRAGAKRWTWQGKGDTHGGVNSVTVDKNGVLLGGFFSPSSYGGAGRGWIAQLSARGKQRWVREYGKGQTEAVEGALRTATGIVAAGRHGSRKSYLSGMWIFGVDPKGLPDGLRTARGAAK
jgi:hypothetical protein